VLAAQGEDDEYGTMAQIDAIARLVPYARLLKLPACGHSPHRDQPRALIENVMAFLNEHARAAMSRVG
jgi:pimeloyl-ACP methyl ester carboxylesterase